MAHEESKTTRQSIEEAIEQLEGQLAESVPSGASSAPAVEQGAMLVPSLRRVEARPVASACRLQFVPEPPVLACAACGGCACLLHNGGATCSHCGEPMRVRIGRIYFGNRLA